MLKIVAYPWLVALTLILTACPAQNTLQRKEWVLGDVLTIHEQTTVYSSQGASHTELLESAPQNFRVASAWLTETGPGGYQLHLQWDFDGLPPEFWYTLLFREQTGFPGQFLYVGNEGLPQGDNPSGPVFKVGHLHRVDVLAVVAAPGGSGRVQFASIFIDLTGVKP